MPEVAERSTVDILRAARERITPEEAWTTRAYARSAGALRVGSNSKQACCWCAVGALFAELDDFDYSEWSEPLVEALDAAALDLGFDTDVFDVNDSQGHAAVLSVYDRAIQLAEQEAQRG